MLCFQNLQKVKFQKLQNLYHKLGKVKEYDEANSRYNKIRNAKIKTVRNDLTGLLVVFPIWGKILKPGFWVAEKHWKTDAFLVLK